jgi:hypothetical protein
MNDELEMAWKEEVVAYFKAVFHNLPERSEEIPNVFNQDSRSPH